MNASIRLSRDLQQIAADLQQAIDKSAGEPVAFTLLVYTAGRASYISTAPRAESVREIKRLLANWEAGAPDVPAHEYSS